MTELNPPKELRPPLQNRQQIVIQAPLRTVWDFNLDLEKIARYHPRVEKVDFISGSTRREAGVAYCCHLKDGKNRCTQKDIEIVPLKKTVTIMAEDTLGLRDTFPDYVVETLFTPIDENTTLMEFLHYYSTRSMKAKLAGLVARRRIAEEAQDTLNAIKSTIEKGGG